MKIRLLPTLLMLALFAVSMSSFGQGVTTGAISGVVSDEKGETLPGANVVAVHTPSGTQYGATTRVDGRFNFPAVRVGGPYKITITFVGYETQAINNISVSLGQNLDLKINLNPAAQTLDEVVVTGNADKVFNSDRTGAGANIGVEQIQAIPTMSRSITDMTRLMPQSSGNSFAGRNNLYNNLSIDGSVFNNSFGLAATPGGQTNAQPISLDAIEEVQVSLAPYDVRQSGFTGAGINAVTRSGTNDFSGSVYHYFRNQNFVGKKVADVDVVQNDFSQRQSGFRLGGPIVKNKVFFFINGEMERRADPGTTLRAKRTAADTTVEFSKVSADSLDKLHDFLLSKFGYEAGAYEGYSLRTENNKFLARVDWNINQNHRASLRYNYLQSFRDALPSASNSANSSRFPSVTCLPFENNGYIINNNISSIVGEVNSVFGNSMSNNLIVGYSMFRDFRESKTDKLLPMVDILSGGTTFTSFGYEQFTANNKLDTDVFQISDNFTMYMNKHTLTFGASLEHFSFANGFMPQFYGYYRFNSLNDFIANASGNYAMRPAQYQLTYSALPGGEVPLARLKAMQLGVYAQDEFAITSRIKITPGVRIDMPSYPIELQKNPMLDTLSFLDPDGNAEKLDVSKYPSAKLLVSPRLGFNIDVTGEKTVQLRGGLGIFTGRIPFVWLSNQASNNGVLFGSIFAQGNPAAAYYFTDDVTKFVPDSATLPATVTLNATDDDFKFPQIFRGNIATDLKLPGGVIATLEFLYTKDLNAVFHRDANLVMPTGTAADGRDTFPNVSNAANKFRRRVNANILNAYVLDNTDQGYSYFGTVQLQKAFDFGLGLMVAYTYGEAKDLTSSPGSIASSSFTGNAVQGNPNKPTLSWANYDMRNKIASSVSFQREYLNHFKSSIMVMYIGMKGGSGSSNELPSDGKFSYTYSGDVNFDGISGNDLIYIPKDSTDILLVPNDDPKTPQIEDTRTKQEIWKQLDAYITQDEYLNAHRGEIMMRNGAVTPFVHQVDMRFTQDFFLNVAGKRNTVQVSVDVINLGNLLNPAWGVKKTITKRNFLAVYDYKGPNGAPRFTVPYLDAATKTPLTSTFIDNTGLVSRWQVQFGLRYIFN